MFAGSVIGKTKSVTPFTLKKTKKVSQKFPALREHKLFKSYLFFLNLNVKNLAIVRDFQHMHPKKKSHMLVTKEKFRRPELFKNVYLFFQILNQPKATFCFHKTNFVYSLSSQLKYSRTVINEKVPIHFSERYDKD